MKTYSHTIGDIEVEIEITPDDYYISDIIGDIGIDPDDLFFICHRSMKQVRYSDWLGDIAYTAFLDEYGSYSAMCNEDRGDYEYHSSRED